MTVLGERAKEQVLRRRCPSRSHHSRNRHLKSVGKWAEQKVHLVLCVLCVLVLDNSSLLFAVGEAARRRARRWPLMLLLLLLGEDLCLWAIRHSVACIFWWSTVLTPATLWVSCCFKLRYQVPPSMYQVRSTILCITRNNGTTAAAKTTAVN